MTSVLSNALVRVPKPMLLEAPSSWLSRAALSQGIGLPALLAHLGLPPAAQLDLSFGTVNLAQLGRAVGMDLWRLETPQVILRRVASLRRSGVGLLIEKPVASAFRFCPVCWRSQTVYYVPVHWRVATWIYCPEHLCLMVNRCPRCDRPPASATSFIGAGPKGKGIAGAYTCGHCGGALNPEPVMLVGGGTELTDFDWLQLQNGRAALAALLGGEVYLNDATTAESTRGLVMLFKMGLIPRNNEALFRRMSVGSNPASIEGPDTANLPVQIW